MYTFKQKFITTGTVPGKRSFKYLRYFNDELWGEGKNITGHDNKSVAIRQYQIDFLFSVTWKKIQCAMSWNHFIFIKKTSMREKQFSFYFIKLSWKRFFMKEFKWKIFTVAISPISRWKYSAFSVQIRVE